MTHSSRQSQSESRPVLGKRATGVEGLDEVLAGGLPDGRTTVVCGGPGCGKTVLAMEFIANGALKYDEPGVFVSFEESTEDLVANVRSLGIDLETLIGRNKVALSRVIVDRSELVESGAYDLEGLILRIGHQLDRIGAKRIALDTLETILGGLSDTAILRAELHRLFRWLRERGVTAIVTAERGDSSLTRQGLEEYVADCVLLIDHRIEEQISTRRLRVVKYRGSHHGADEYPFTIGADGISIVPITSMRLDHGAPTERVSSGTEDLDRLFGGGGYYRGSSILVSGEAGTGKSTLAASFLQAAAARGELGLFFAFEESQDQIVRNMASVGLDLGAGIDAGKLQISATRPSFQGLETHLAEMQRLIRQTRPTVVVVDPVSNLTVVGHRTAVRGMLMRLIDFMKSSKVTALFTSLTSSRIPNDEQTGLISSLMDTWIVLRNDEAKGVGSCRRRLQIKKSRGMAHSNDIHEFLLDETGITLSNSS